MQLKIASRLAFVFLAVAPALSSCDVGAAAPKAPIVVYVDGSEALVLEAGDVSAPVDLLAALGLAPESVRYAEVRAAGETPIRVSEPMQRYPKRILAAFPAAEGIGVGWVDRVLGELPRELPGPPPVSFVPATEVRLRTLDVERVASSRPKLPLRVAVGGVELEYTEDLLDGLPVKGPGQQLGINGGRQALSGVPIASVVADALVRAEKGTLADVAGVVLRGAGAELRFAPEDLVEGTTRAASVKRNRQGLWRVKLWELADGRAAERDGMRDLEVIEIELRD